MTAEDEKKGPINKKITRSIEGLIFPHSQYVQGLENIMELIEGGSPLSIAEIDDSPLGDFTERDDIEDTAEISASCLLIIGRTGTGKTSLMNSVDALSELKPIKGGPDGDILPIVEIMVPDPATPKGVIAELCTALNIPMPARFSKRAISTFLRKTVDELGIRLIKMEEAHVFAEELTDKQIRTNARFLKWLLIYGGVPIIMAGEEALEDLLDYGAFARRNHPPVRLRPYGWKRIAEVTEFRALIGAMETAVGMQEASSPRLSAIEQAARLYYASQGVVGLLGKLFIHAATEAQWKGETSLSLQSFAIVWERWAAISEEVSAGPYEFEADSSDFHPDNPFACSEGQFAELWSGWRKQVASVADTSGSTRRRRRPKVPKPDRLFLR